MNRKGTRRKEWRRELEREKDKKFQQQHNSHSATLTPTAQSEPSRFYMQQFWWCHQVFIFFASCGHLAYLWQISNVICVQQQLLQASGVAQNVFGHIGQGAMPLIHELHLTIASFEDWNALEHCVGSKLLRALLKHNSNSNQFSFAFVVDVLPHTVQSISSPSKIT